MTAHSYLDLLQPVDLKKRLNANELVNQKNDLFDLLQTHNLIKTKVGARHLVFFSLKHGAGSSELAFNTALYLAENHKVLYLTTELNNSIFYEYQLDIKHKILNTLTDLNDFESKIIHYSDLRAKFDKDNSLQFMKRNLKQFFPNNLNYLEVSPEFQAELIQYEDDQISKILSDVSVYANSKYDFIIIDTENDLHNLVTQLWLNYSRDLILTFTQNITHVNRVGNLLETVDMKMPDTNVYPVVNLYTENTIRDLEVPYLNNLIGEDTLAAVPLMYESYQNAAYNGIPIIYYEKNGATRNAIRKIINSLNQNRQVRL